MQLQYLGTGAAEGWPGLFCNCKHCETARLLGRRNIRTRSQAVLYADAVGTGDIDDILLIDLPPDTYMHVLQHGVRLDKIGHLIVTHSHGDHFAPGELGYRGKSFASPIPNFTLNVYGNDKVKARYDNAMALFGEDGKTVGIEFHEIENFVPFQAGAYTVTGMPALHDRSERCLIFMIEHENKRVLYGNDTGIFPDETFEFIAGKQFDLVSLDCTNGIESEGTNHMGMPDAQEVKRRMSALDCLKPATKIVLNHFSHNGGPPYDAIVKLAADVSMDVSYDGGIWSI